MQLKIDRVIYNVNLANVARHLQVWYNNNKHLSDTLILENGKKIDFSRKSLSRIALKTALVPIAIPTLQATYKLKGAELPPHEKHEDLIDYCIFHMLGLIALFDKDKLYVETLECDKSDERLVHAISTSEPATIASRSSAGEETPEKEI